MAGTEGDSVAAMVAGELEALVAEEVDMIGLQGKKGQVWWEGGRKKGSNALLPCRIERITTHLMWVGSLSYIGPIRHTWQVQI